MNSLLRNVMLLATLCFLGTGIACQNQGPARAKSDGAPACVGQIESAEYTGTGPNGPNSRTEVLVNGSCFKLNPAVSDCQTRQPWHPVPSQRQWRDCTKVRNSSALMCHVEAYHSASYDSVEIRIRGQDGGWSNAKTIGK